MRREAARNPRTTPAALTVLAQDDGDHVRDILAENPSCPPHVLVMLAESGNPPSWIPADRACPPQLLARYASAGIELPVVAANPACPPQTLATLAVHPTAAVRAAVAANPAAPPQAVDAVAGGDINQTVLRALPERALTLSADPPHAADLMQQPAAGVLHSTAETTRYGWGLC